MQKWKSLTSAVLLSSNVPKGQEIMICVLLVMLLIARKGVESG